MAFIYNLAFLAFDILIARLVGNLISVVSNVDTPRAKSTSPDV